MAANLFRFSRPAFLDREFSRANAVLPLTEYLKFWLLKISVRGRSGSVRGPREVCSGSVRGPRGVRAGSAPGPRGVRSGSVRDPFEVRSGSVRANFAPKFPEPKSKLSKKNQYPRRHGEYPKFW